MACLYEPQSPVHLVLLSVLLFCCHPVKLSSISLERAAIKIHFIYSSNKETYCIFKTWCIILFYFPQNAIYFIILSLFCSNNTQVFHKPADKG